MPINRRPVPQTIFDAQNILKMALEVISGERQEEYGSPEDSFEEIGKLWDEGETPYQVAIKMIKLKLARESNKHKLDNLVDICGYAALAGGLKLKEKRQQDAINACETINPDEEEMTSAFRELYKEMHEEHCCDECSEHECECSRDEQDMKHSTVSFMPGIGKKEKLRMINEIRMDLANAANALEKEIEMENNHGLGKPTIVRQ